MTLQILPSANFFEFVMVFFQRPKDLRDARSASTETLKASHEQRQFALEMMTSNIGSFASELDVQNMMEHYCSGR